MGSLTTQDPDDLVGVAREALGLQPRLQITLKLGVVGVLERVPLQRDVGVGTERPLQGLGTRFLQGQEYESVVRGDQHPLPASGTLGSLGPTKFKAAPLVRSTAVSNIEVQGYQRPGWPSKTTFGGARPCRAAFSWNAPSMQRNIGAACESRLEKGPGNSARLR